MKKRENILEKGQDTGPQPALVHSARETVSWL